MIKKTHSWKSIFSKLGFGILILFLFVYAQCPTVIPPEGDRLPPDPGEAGKATIAGIDSDNDGVRDELQRYIALTYPDDEETQKALTDYVIAYQDFVLELDDKEATIRNAEAMKQAMICVFCARQTQDDTFEVLAEMKGKIFNTADRVEAYISAEKHLGGITFSISPSEDQCARCQGQDTISRTSVLSETLSERGRCPGDDFDVAIYFGNGVSNSLEDAVESMKMLQKRFGDETANGEKIKYSISYNENEKWYLQLLEVYRQKNFDYAECFFKFIKDSSLAPEWYKSAYKDILTEASNKNYINDVYLRSHVSQYLADIFEGKKVIVVAHSQGNFYANEAHKRVYADSQVKTKSFGILAVGTPSGYVAGGGYHTTLEEDKVILGVRLLYPFGVLDPNTNNSQLYEPLGHMFIKSYLNGDISGPKIIRQIRNTIEQLDEPPEEANQGIITVTLTWGSQPDVDLHVYEPNGSHVFYGNPQGTSGYLDVDDTSGYGPEHYYADCETLQTGTYQIGVNYYYGERPETAIIQVHAHNIYREYRVHLSQAVGPYGDNSPIMFAQIQVTLDENDYFVFDVSGY